jgi:lambda repressor-like predicted transcriptional regulator
MTKRQIIGAIIAATDKSVEQLAVEHDYSKHAIYDVIRRRTKTPHLRKLISGLIDKPINEIWPD